LPAAVGTRRLSLLVVALLTVQLALGTIVRQTGEHVLLHVGGASAVTFSVLWLLLRVFRHHGKYVPLRRIGGLLGVLLVTQVFLGITPWMLTGGELVSTDPASGVALMRTAHVTVGALLLALAAMLSLWAHRLAVPEVDYPLSAHMRDYYVLTKARLSGLVMVTVAAGYLLAGRAEAAEGNGTPDWSHMAVSLIGVALVAAGVAALNQYLERDRDALMNRTRNRPLPSGRMKPREALAFGLITVFGGSALLLFAVNWLAALLTFLTAFLYVCVYTPLKTRTTLNTLIGAITGALPPVAGWAAATGEVSLQAFILFAILYVWQLPHFWAIARIYREDYERGGMQMLSVVDKDGGFLARQIAIWCVVLTAVSLLPVLVGMANGWYATAALILGGGFFGSAVINAQRRTRATTRGVFFASLIYLPLLLAALIAAAW
jgi:protoheme IX farnesyltransferase